MHAWEQIQKTLDYMEEHLSETMDIETLAGIAALSPFYYQRLFSRLVKKPVMEYIRLRRLAMTTEKLLQKDRRILDVALDAGFPSHEYYSRIFKEAFGMNPEEYRRNPVPLNRMTKPQLLLNYTFVDEGVPLISEGIVLEVNRRTLEKPEYCIGLQAEEPIGLIAGLGVESGVDPLDTLWRTFHDKKEKVLGLIPDGEEIGVTYPSVKEGYFCYLAGGKTEHACLVPDGFKSFILPAGEYIVCSFEAENFEHLVMDVLYKAEQYLFGMWLPGHGLSSEPFCAERYRRHDADTTRMEVWVLPTLVEAIK